MSFNEHSGNADGNGSAGKHRRKFALAAGSSALPAGLLDGMGCIENNRTAGFFGHDRQTAEVGYQRIIAETGAAFGQANIGIARIFGFFDNMFHIPGCTELTFF